MSEGSSIGANTSLAQVLQSTRMSAVTMFGIVAPGTWFWMTSVVYLALLFGGFSHLTSVKDAAIEFTGTRASWLLSFLIIYVTGSVLRILPPDGPDKFSLGLISFSGDQGIRRGDRFPYESLPKYLETRGLTGLLKEVPWSGQGPQRGKRSKTFLHFVKLYIADRNPHIANHLARQEAFIRLLSGVVYAALLSSIH